MQWSLEFLNYFPVEQQFSQKLESHKLMGLRINCLEFSHFDWLSRFRDGERAGRGELEGAWVWVASSCNIPKT